MNFLKTGFFKNKLFIWFICVISSAVLIYFTYMEFQGKLVISETISIGDIQLRIYGFVVISAVLVSAVFLERLIKEISSKDKLLSENLEKLDIYEMLVWAIIPGILFARIVYFLSNISIYENFSDIFRVWEGGMSIFGAVIGGIVGIIIYLKKSKIKFFPILDIIFITIPLGHAIGRWANFINQEIYGPPTNLPWKMYVSPERRIGIPTEYLSENFFHPLFLYEFLFNLGLFFLLYSFFKSNKKRFNGFYISFYLFVYGLIRFFIEFLRFDPKVFYGLSAAQYISLLFILGGGGFLIYKLFLEKRNGKS